MLRSVIDNPVRARHQELGRNDDRVRVGDDTLGGVVESEQNVDRDGSRDQRIGIVARDSHRIVCQEAGLDVTVDEEVAAQLVEQGETGSRERNVELDLEGRGGEHHAANVRRVVVHPGGDEHRTYALRDDADILDRNPMPIDDMVDERLYIAHRARERGTETAHARRTTMATRIPGEEVEIGNIELIGQMRHASRVFVPPVKQDQRATPRPSRRPVPIEELRAVVGGEAAFEHLPSRRYVAHVIHVTRLPATRPGRYAHD